SGYGLYGTTDGVYGTGVYGTASGEFGYGVYGSAYGYMGYAGYFYGEVQVTGYLSKGGGSFLIDHPLDPENKLLRHNFVESPENLLIYRGKTQLDTNGQAVVEMPEYFASLTKENEATVSLTSIGRPFPAGYEWQTGYTVFTVYGDPGREVSWVVYADRDDPVIHQLGRPVEEEKGADKVCDRGQLLYPTAYGYPETMGRDYKPPVEKEADMPDRDRDNK
ncbi:MAG: hypothetical protein GY869_14635, partial [Planctomycetes bacterium]|nr:hypothetical protein [Planctomycetota bacterium]